MNEKICHFYLNFLKIFQASPGSQVYGVVKVTVHPKYFYGAFYNDIGLLRLATDVFIDNKLVSIGCLHYGSRRSLSSKEAIIVGWGDNDDPKAPTTLHKGTVR